jgi:hypothetical protein
MLLTDQRALATRTAFVWSRLLTIPFWVLFSMLPIIVYKELHATPWQVTAMIALKPIAALISPYWSMRAIVGRDRLVFHLILGHILRFLPFLIFPFLTNCWWIVFAFGYYMVFLRGTIPVWTEILKVNIPEVARERVFVYGSAIDFLGSALLPLALGWMLDDYYYQSWRWLFPLTAILGLLAIPFLYRIPLNRVDEIQETPKQTFQEQVIRPWRLTWKLIKERPSFGRFQLGFMLGGSGLMIVQPGIPMFFVDSLHLSYTEMMLAISVCKGIGFAATSPFWLKWFGKVDIFRFNSIVTMLCALFPLILLSAQFHIGWVYFAYLCYGMMQAGSELGWNMSGAVFSKELDSSVYTMTNVLTVGIRGCIVPLIGNLLFQFTGATPVMLIGSFLCLLATERMVAFSRREEKVIA